MTTARYGIEKDGAASDPIPFCQSLDPAGIPNELKELPRWVAWRSNPRPAGKKPEKVPINPATGRPADISNPGTWGTFHAALRRCQDDALAGIGFVFADDGFAGVDLDGCRDPASDELASWAEAIVKEFGTYTEVSPSGTGVKLIARGRLDPNGRRRNGQIEVYDHSRFFALTGCRLPSAPSSVVACQDALSALQERLEVPNGDPRPDPPASGGAFDGPDAELLALAFSARNGECVRALWEGEHSSYLSFSEALLALAQFLAFYTGRDEDRLERLMHRSPLLRSSEAEREKWDAPRRCETWGRVYVVRKAIESCRTFYSGPCGVGHNTYTGVGASLPPSSAASARPVAIPSDAGSSNAVERAWAKVEASEFPPAASRLAETSQKLAALCWHLSGRGSRRFFLDVRTAEKVLGVPRNTVWRRLKAIEATGMIRIVRVGRYHAQAQVGFATEFEWVGEGEAVTSDRASPDEGVIRSAPVCVSQPSVPRVD